MDVERHELIAREIARAGLDEGSARAAMMVAQVLDDADFTVLVVHDLMRRAHLDHTTASIAFSDALYAMIAAAKNDTIKTTSRAWVFGVARRKANARSEILHRDADGRPHAVQLSGLHDGLRDADDPFDDGIDPDALERWRELLPALGWELAELVWNEVIDALLAGGPVLDVRTLAEAVGRSPAAVKTAYYEGRKRLARLARERGLVDVSDFADDVLVGDDDDEEEPRDDD